MPKYNHKRFYTFIDERKDSVCLHWRGFTLLIDPATDIIARYRRETRGHNTNIATIIHDLRTCGRLHGDRKIVSRQDKSIHRYTFADFYRRSRQLAEVLSSTGLKTRTCWTLLEPCGTLACISASLRGGVLAAPKPTAACDELVYIVNHADDRFRLSTMIYSPCWKALKKGVIRKNLRCSPWQRASWTEWKTMKICSLRRKAHSNIQN